MVIQVALTKKGTDHQTGTAPWCEEHGNSFVARSPQDTVKILLVVAYVVS
jgi:hypothetical protein